MLQAFFASDRVCRRVWHPAMPCPMQEDVMGYERSAGRYYRDDADRRFGGRDRDDYRDREFRGRRAEYDRPRDEDDERGFFDRAGDEVRSWFGDEEAERRRRWDERVRDREEERRYGEGGRYADLYSRQMGLVA